MSFIVLQNIIVLGISALCCLTASTIQSSPVMMASFLYFSTEKRIFCLLGLIMILKGFLRTSFSSTTASVLSSAVPVNAATGVPVNIISIKVK